MRTLTLTPFMAKYPYHKLDQVIAAWHDNQDFRVMTPNVRGTYCSISCMEYILAEGFTHIKLLCANKSKVLALYNSNQQPTSNLLDSII